MFVVSISLVWRGSVATRAALCTTASQPASASRTETRSVMSPTAKSDTSRPGWAKAFFSRAGFRTRNRMECPASAMALAVHPPTNPVPPVTRTRVVRFCTHRELGLQVTCGVVCGLARHAVERLGRMREGVVAVTADSVAWGAQLEGLGLIQRADDDRRCAVLLQELIRRCPEQRDRGDMVCDIRRHGRGHHCGRYARRYGRRGDETGYGRALGVSAEHLPGLRTVRRHGLDMRTGVTDAVDDRHREIGRAEVGTGLGVDRI